VNSILVFNRLQGDFRTLGLFCAVWVGFNDFRAFERVFFALKSMRRTFLLIFILSLFALFLFLFVILAFIGLAGLVSFVRCGN
jgi:hypothetical protein